MIANGERKFQKFGCGVIICNAEEWLKTASTLEDDVQTLAAYIGLLKVMRDYDLQRFALRCGDLNFETKLNSKTTVVLI